MSRILSVLTLGCLTAIGVTTYSMLYGNETERIKVPNGKAPAIATQTDDSEESELATALGKARRSYSAEQITQVIGQLQHRVTEKPEDRASWRGLAEALLHRVVQRGHLLGLRPGRPVYSRLPKEITTDLDDAQSAIERARALGDDSGHLFRLSAEVMSQRITGLSTALKWNGRIEEAIATAGKLLPDDPELHLVLGVRKLMAPRFFGQNVEKSLEHFRYVAEALPRDERPAIFAAMANYLTKKRMKARDWLVKAVERNPDNVFARVVLRRVLRGEENPFGRDVSAAEASGGK